MLPLHNLSSELELMFISRIRYGGCSDIIMALVMCQVEYIIYTGFQITGLYYATDHGELGGIFIYLVVFCLRRQKP